MGRIKTYLLEKYTSYKYLFLDLPILNFPLYDLLNYISSPKNLQHIIELQ